MSIETHTQPSGLQSASFSRGALGKKPANTTRWAIVSSGILGIEFVAVACSAYIASVIYRGTLPFSSLQVDQYTFEALFLAALVSLVSLGFRHFSAIQTRPLHVLLWNGIGAVGLAFSLLLSTFFLLKISEGYSRVIFIFQVAWVSGAVIAVRMISYSWVRSAIASSAIAARRVVLIGNPTHCTQFKDQFRTSAIKSVASLRPPWDGDITTEGDDAYPTDQLIETCRAMRPDDIIVLATLGELSKAMSLASSLAELPVGLRIVPVDALEVLAGSSIAEFGGVLTVQVHRPPLSPFELAIKRSFDVFAATIGLIVLSPILLAASIAIKLDSHGPVLFNQKRHGINGKTIRVLKFRSMTALEDGDQFTQAVKYDRRVTRVGRLLRRTNVDELPQLINVLRGDMSIVGPRPHAIAHNALFQAKIAPFSRRHLVKPGITGWAQVNGLRGETDTLRKMQQRVEHDLYYIDNWSFLFDMKIIMLTLLSKRAYINAY